MKEQIVKFQKGGKVNSTCWFTGGTFVYQVIEVRDGHVCLQETSFNLDGNFTQEPKWYDIDVIDGVECVLFFEYQGHKNYLSAGEQYF